MASKREEYKLKLTEMCGDKILIIGNMSFIFFIRNPSIWHPRKHPYALVFSFRSGLREEDEDEFFRTRRTYEQLPTYEMITEHIEQMWKNWLVKKAPALGGEQFVNSLSGMEIYLTLKYKP